MRVILVAQFGGPEVLEYTTLDDPEPGPDQVLIRARGAGVNFADVLTRKGGYHHKRPFPFVPGLDVAGTIEKVGPAVQRVKPGQRVVAFPLNGSYSELAVATEALTFPIPDSISDETAAACPVVAGTSYSILARIARLQPGESVLIHSAAGGVGTTALQLARYFGASPIITTVGSDRKKTLLEDLGVHAVANYRTEDYAEQVLALTAGKGVDVILNPLAGGVLERDLKCLAPFGRLVCFGHAEGRSASIASTELHSSCRSVLGFSFGATRRLQPDAISAVMQAVIPLLAEGTIRMVIGKRFSLQEAAAAHRYLESRRSTGKILLNIA